MDNNKNISIYGGERNLNSPNKNLKVKTDLNLSPSQITLKSKFEKTPTPSNENRLQKKKTDKSFSKIVTSEDIPKFITEISLEKELKKNGHIMSSKLGKSK